MNKYAIALVAATALGAAAHAETADEAARRQQKERIEMQRIEGDILHKAEMKRRADAARAAEEEARRKNRK